MGGARLCPPFPCHFVKFFLEITARAHVQSARA
jgi:hypothetical protein